MVATGSLNLAAALALVPAGAQAAVMTFGSNLASPPTLNTTENLGYAGTTTASGPSAQYPHGGELHTYHYGADTAMWNTTVAGGEATSPATGQAVKLSVEGCAQPAPGGPAPLTQVHFQDLGPLPGGGVHVNLTSGAFDLPVCGENGNPSTVTTYEPINLCVAKGDYVDLNDEGGWVPYIYQSGVPYQIIGSSRGSVMDSFIRGNGTNDGANLSSSDTTAMDGFAQNRSEELMMRVTLGTGSDATHICPGGTAGLPPALPALRIRPQTDGVNRSQSAAVAIYCRPANGCSGIATLEPAGKVSGYGTKRGISHTTFSLPGGRTGHLRVHLSSALMSLIRKRHGAQVLVTAVMGGATFSETVTLKVL